MDRHAEAKLRYEQLKTALADDRKVRKKTSRARIIGLVVVGAWVIVPAASWRVDVESARQPEFFRTPTPHEAHLLSLPRGAAEGAANAREWEAASLRAIDFPLSPGSAYQEIGLFPPAPSQALGLRLRIPRGQRLHLDVRMEDGDRLPLFVDLYRAAPDSLLGGEAGDTRRPAFLVGEAMEAGGWVFDSPETGQYVVRLQPREGDGGRFGISARVGAPWQFPVAGAGEIDIGSVFGDSRDGGRREHHGVDIFMPRGTPVLAAAAGRVTSVDTTDIGGRVVWQREAEGRHAIYYAHLDRALVRDGQQLEAGDTVGLVGNTGNARTTPPHLHFGAYRRGAVDPWDLILPIPPQAPEVVVDLGGLGANGNVSEEGVRLRRGPSTRGSILGELDTESSFRVMGGAGEWYRVVFQGGMSGFLHSRYVVLATPGGTQPSNQQ
ncbi:MAG: peptidoglycan DD-metalloendopeptidase family protein [Gemmatimonadetes bacterium]|nr:M23 family metallopeptidase [Gemmatimonadota bacterium]NNM04514.1 peptidoglycan DD-metalloendopeptidase family protein [Gemmatimonadota bacterium]